MTIHEEIQELIPVYVLGACEADEARRIERHVGTCPTCTAVLKEYQPVAEALALEPPWREPPADLKLRTMQRALAPERSRPIQRSGAPSRSRWPRLGLPSLLASTALALALVALLWGVWQTVQLSNEVAQERHLMTVVAYAQGTATIVHGTDIAPQAVGRLYLDPDSNVAALITVNMPPLADDKAYQVWLTDPNGQKVSGGLFTLDKDGYGLHLIRAPQNLGNYAQVGVTTEPRSGSPGPTSQPVLLVRFPGF